MTINMDKWSQDKGGNVTPIKDAQEESDELKDGNEYGQDYPVGEEEHLGATDNEADTKKKWLVSIGTYVAGAAILLFVLFQVGTRLGLIPRGAVAQQDFSQPVANFSQPVQTPVIAAPVPPQAASQPDPMMAEPGGAPVAPVVTPTSPSATPVAPVPSDQLAQASAAPAAPGLLTSAPATAPSAPLDASPIPKAPGSEVDRVKAAAEVERLNGEVSDLRTKVAAIEAKLASISTQAVQQQAKPVPPAAPKPVQAKPAAQPKPVVAQPAQPAATSSKAAPVKTEAKVSPRSDYRMYAIRDGRAWVKSAKDGEIVLVAVDGSLPDGSRVKSIHEETGVIVTSAGEIR